MFDKSLFAFLIATAVAVTTCKQSEFSGNSDSGKKGAGTTPGSANIQNSTDVVATPTPTPLPTIVPGTQLPGGTPLPGGCVSPPTEAVITFESNPVGPFDGNTFWATTGVRFLTNMRVVATTRQGQPQPPQEAQAWQCIKCPKSPSRNRLMDSTAEAQVGLHVLASTTPQNATQALDMAFANPVAAGSFDLIDDDGSEAWSLILFNANSQVLENRPLSTLKGYRPSNTGNGRPMTLTFSRPQADVAGLRLIGAKPNGFFGFAFDNFNILACPVVSK